MCFFFFKQKTAYEMRISDWSSDVCSSDLSSDLALVLAAGQVLADLPEGYATVANFRSKGVPRPNRILLSGSFFIYVVGSAVLSYVLLRNAPDALKMAALVFVAGLLTVAAVEEQIGRASFRERVCEDV